MKQFVNKEVFVKHEKAPTAPRFLGVFTISYMPMFRKTAVYRLFLANFGHFQWTNLAKTVKRHLYRPIPFR